MKQADHLGNMLIELGTMEHDAEIKRAKCINSAVDIGEVFKNAAPAEVIKAMKVHSSSGLIFGTWEGKGLSRCSMPGTPQ